MGKDWLDEWPAADAEKPLRRAELVMALAVVRDALKANYELALAVSSDPSSLGQRAKEYLDADDRLITYLTKTAGFETDVEYE